MYRYCPRLQTNENTYETPKNRPYFPIPVYPRYILGHSRHHYRIIFARCCSRTSFVTQLFCLTGYRRAVRVTIVSFRTIARAARFFNFFDPEVSPTDFKTAAMTNLNGVLTPPSTPSPNLLQMNMAREREKYLEEYNFPFCEAATKFEKLAKIGQGTFGYKKLYVNYGLTGGWGN